MSWRPHTAAYVTSLAAGVGAGALYALLGVPTPAPPPPALTGLAGIVVGERLARAVRDRRRTQPKHQDAQPPA